MIAATPWPRHVLAASTQFLPLPPDAASLTCACCLGHYLAVPGSEASPPVPAGCEESENKRRMRGVVALTVIL